MKGLRGCVAEFTDITHLLADEVKSREQKQTRGALLMPSTAHGPSRRSQDERREIRPGWRLDAAASVVVLLDELPDCSPRRSTRTARAMPGQLASSACQLMPESLSTGTRWKQADIDLYAADLPLLMF